MPRALIILAVALFPIACDPVGMSTLRLAPAPASVSAPATGEPRTDPLAAAERVAASFGLQPRGEYGGCPRLWYLGGNRRTDGPRGGGADLTMCAQRDTAGGLEVHVGEIRGWSPFGNRLRRALSDTLARYGSVTER